MTEPISASVSILNAKNLIAVAMAFACSNVEPLSEYKRLKEQDQKWGTHEAKTLLSYGNPKLARICEELPAATPVEVVETLSEDPSIIKIRVSDPNQLIRDASGNIVGKGVSRELYGFAQDYGEEVSSTVDLPQPSAKVLAQRKRIQELMEKRGLPGAHFVIPGE
jgi:hypothetical protein